MTVLYGHDQVGDCWSQLQAILRRHRSERPSDRRTPPALSERDVLLICYPDQVQEPGRPPLDTLATLLADELDGLVSAVHLLPFYPSSSDDGFSVIDYRAVDPAFGTWEAVRRIAATHRLMVDAVINHVSAQSEWFQRFLSGDPQAQASFIAVDPGTDLSQVVRPRDRPLLTAFDTARGRQHLWTTFSADQVDLNYASPQVLLAILDLLLFYVRQGAQLLRLDAIAYLWKTIGTPSIHLPQTHATVRLFRAVLELAEPGVLLLTETNVPDEENRSYFGNGRDEAHLVYQFSLPPLMLHTLLTGDATRLNDWAARLPSPGPRATFLNFLASHDGIGLRPAASVLSEPELTGLTGPAARNGGGVSYRATGGGRAPYELNCTYFDALTEPDELATAPASAVDRFLVAQSIMLALAGLPGIYFHSLLGSRNDLAGYRRTGRLRSLNREKLSLAEFRASLSDPADHRGQVWQGMRRMLRARASHSAFDPWADQRILDLGPAVFGLVRESQTAGRVIGLHEVGGLDQSLELPAARGGGLDLLAAERLDGPTVRLRPYQVRWIALDPEGLG